MRRMLLGLAVALVVLAPARAEARALGLTAHDDGGHGGWFAVAGEPGRDPPLAFAPGEVVDITFTNAGSADHNLHFGAPLSALTRLVAPGGTAQLRVEVPANASGRASYWCDPHKGLGMGGEVAFVAVATATPTTPEATPPPAPTPAPHERAPTPLGPATLAALALAAIGARHRNWLEGRDL